MAYDQLQCVVCDDTLTRDQHESVVVVRGQVTQALCATDAKRYRFTAVNTTPLITPVPEGVAA